MQYRERRHPCRYPVNLTASGEDFPAKFVNVSYHGARAQVSPRPRLGEYVTFVIQNLPIQGQVVQIGPQGGVGIKFARPLSKLQLRKISAPNGHQRPAFPVMR